MCSLFHIKMKLVFLCMFLTRTASSISLFELEIQYNQIIAVVEREQETTKQLKAVVEREQESTKQLKAEISELKKKRVSALSRPGSSNSLEELKQDLAVVISKLDSLKSGLETEKVERQRILADLGQVKQWTTNLTTKTGKDCVNSIANFSTENRDNQQDYQEFKTQACDDWDQWLSKANATLSGMEGEFESVKVDLLGQQSRIVNRIDSFAKDLDCLIECEKDWMKQGCISYQLNKIITHYHDAIKVCKKLEASLIQPHEITEIGLHPSHDQVERVWLGVFKYKDKPWTYWNGTEADFIPKNNVTHYGGFPECAYAKAAKGKVLFRTASCFGAYRSICVRRDKCSTRHV